MGDTETWSVNDVYNWLEQNKLKYWTKIFTQCEEDGFGIDGETLLTLDVPTLEADFGETKAIARKQLIAKIGALKNGGGRGSNGVPPPKLPKTAPPATQHARKETSPPQGVNPFAPKSNVNPFARKSPLTSAPTVKEMLKAVPEEKAPTLQISRAGYADVKTGGFMSAYRRRYLRHYKGVKLDMFEEDPKDEQVVPLNTLLPEQIQMIERAKLDQKRGPGFIVDTYSGERFIVRVTDAAVCDEWFDELKSAQTLSKGNGAAPSKKTTMQYRSVRNLSPGYAPVAARPEPKAPPKPTTPEEIEKRRAMLQKRPSYIQRTPNVSQFRRQFSTLSSCSNCGEARDFDKDGRLQKYCHNCGFEFPPSNVFRPLSRQPSMLRAPEDVKVKRPLRILVLGAGPAGMGTAIRFAELLGDECRIAVYESRLFKEPETGRWFYGRPGGRRRDQVVTLQDEVVWKFFSQETEDKLFENVNERVWPNSRNIPVREVESQLTQRAQDFPEIIQLVPERMTPELFEEIDEFDIVVGGDGNSSRSMTKQHIFNTAPLQNVAGSSLAMGVCYQKPEGRKPFLPQAMNSVLTISQCRYLLNSSELRGTGYLNIQLTPKEWDELKGVDGDVCTFGKPCFVRGVDGKMKGTDDEGRQFWAQRNNTQLWQAIEDGLRYFQIPTSSVTNIIGIPIAETFTDPTVKTIEKGKWKGKWAATVGDAAFQVHFWPGRGMNSAWKGALSLVTTVVNLWAKTPDPKKWKMADFDKHVEYYRVLRDREHRGRGDIIIKTSGDPKKMEQLWTDGLQRLVKDGDQKLLDQMNELYSANAFRYRHAFRWDNSRFSWGESITRAQTIMQSLHPASVAMMVLSKPWPNAEMGKMGEPFPDQMSEETRKKLAKRQDREIKELESVWDAEGLEGKKVRKSQSKA